MILLYMFVLCMERLAHQIYHKVEGRYWKPIKTSRGGPTILHLLCADDSLQFAEVLKSQVEIATSCLLDFLKAPRQKINFVELKLFFSANMDENEASVLSRAADIPRTEELRRYLGISLIHRWVNRNSYGDSREI